MKNCEIIKHGDTRFWTPIRVKAKREKKLAEFCRLNGIIYYLPLRRTLKRYDKKTVEFYIPMFSGYVFCQINDSEFKDILKTNHALFKVDVDQTLEKKLVDELNDILLIEEASLTEDILVLPELSTGRKIRIIRGPLAGISGYVERRKDKMHISVNVDLLGQSVGVILDVGEVELEDQ